MLSQGLVPPSLIRGHLVEQPPCEPITTFYLTNEDEVADTSLVRFLRAGGDSHRFAYSAELQEHMTMTEDNLMSVIEQSNARLRIIDPFQKVTTREKIATMRKKYQDYIKQPLIARILLRLLCISIIILVTITLL